MIRIQPPRPSPHPHLCSHLHGQEFVAQAVHDVRRVGGAARCDDEAAEGGQCGEELAQHLGEGVRGGQGCLWGGGGHGGDLSVDKVGWNHLQERDNSNASRCVIVQPLAESCSPMQPPHLEQRVLKPAPYIRLLYAVNLYGGGRKGEALCEGTSWRGAGRCG